MGTVPMNNISNLAERVVVYCTLVAALTIAIIWLVQWLSGKPITIYL